LTNRRKTTFLALKKNMKKLSLILLFIHSALTGFAQLERKLWFGARIEFIKEGTFQGIKILNVAGGTCAEMKIQENDIIVEMGKVKLSSADEFNRIIASSKVGDKLEASVLRGGKLKKVSGKVMARPYETDDKTEVIYEEADYKGGKLRVIINKPRKEGKLPALLFIPGYTCSSIDNLNPDHPYKRVVKAYADNGYVTLRIEKSGLGDSKGTPPCESCDLKDEIENFETGLKKLKSLSYVDTAKIFIFGHSMGGVIAPALGARNKVAGIIVYGTVARPWFEYQLQMLRVQNALGGLNPVDVEKSVTESYDLNYRFYVKKEKLEDMAKDIRTDSLLRQEWSYDGKGRIFDRNSEYWRQIQEVSHLDHWSKTSAKVLVLFGESDFQAFSLEDHQMIVNTVNHFHNGNGTLKTFPLTDHFFAKSGSMQEAYNKFTEGKIQQLFDEFNHDVCKSIVAWSDEVIAKPAVKNPPTNSGWEKLQTEAYPGKQDDIAFINENEGWYVNGYGSIYHTRNGGATWEKQLEKKGTFFRCIAFIDSLKGFAGTVGTEYFPNVSDTIPLYKTINGGKTWEPVIYKGPYVKGLCAIDMVKESFIDHGKTGQKIHLYAVGRVGSPANLMVSHDEGQTWTSYSMEKWCKMLFDIKMLDKNIGFACAGSDADTEKSNALILKTTDGGKTWSNVYQSTRPFELTWKCSFPTRNTGYVTIQSYNPDPEIKQQRIAKTTDGGNTWREINLVEDAAAREFGIGFIDDLHGYVGTMKTGYETKDGGASWVPVDLGKACNKIRLYRNEKGKTYGYSIGVHVYKLPTR
jgi:photosystem II stability/assembly factor-like uncharacterized protein/pimeloyl-ACP methyl ester carboxylesterase